MLAGKQWWEWYLEDWVRLVCGEIPSVTASEIVEHGYLNELRIRTLFKTWARAKECAGARTMLLAGRDVWLLELLARLDGFPTVYRPEISGSVAKAMGNTPTFKHMFLVDTGFKGTVPKVLGVEHWKLMCYDPPPYTTLPTRELEKYQLFPENKRWGADYIAGTLESIPKYLSSGNPIWDYPTSPNKKLVRVSQILNWDYSQRVWAAKYDRCIAECYLNLKPKTTYVLSTGRGI